MDFEVVPIATTSYEDWKGTAAAENSLGTSRHDDMIS
jgi:hypothetical protein